MPELPEVETIVRYLRPELCGKRILDLWSNTPRLFRGSGFSKIKKRTLGARIQEISRIGKNIILHLSNGHDLLFHLMMTGNLLLSPRATKDPQIRFWMKLSGRTFLLFRDVRKFGRILLVSHPPQLNLGPDALSLNLEMFKSTLRTRRGIIKNIFLNQKVISGIGNIYSDEILWHAGINPTRGVASLNGREIRGLYSSMRRVLHLAIKKEGTSARDYRKPDGSEGGYYQIRKVYQREGKRCSRDGTVIKRIKIGGRSARFCPQHQK